MFLAKKINIVNILVIFLVTLFFSINAISAKKIINIKDNTKEEFIEWDSLKLQKLRTKIWKNYIIVDEYLWNFERASKKDSIDNKKNKYKSIVSKTYKAIENIENSYMSKPNKQLFLDILTYLVVKLEDNLNSIKVKTK